MALSNRFGWLEQALPEAAVQRRGGEFRPRLEVLEDRVVPSTFVVTNDLNSGVDANGGLSLREAIRRANENPGFDRIVFNITSVTNQTGQPGVISIRVTEPLPALIDPAGVSIDATTQPGFDKSGSRPIIEITGSELENPRPSDSGFLIRPRSLGPFADNPIGEVDTTARSSSNNVIRGFVINSFPFAGVNIVGGDNNIIVGNWIGTNTAGDGGPDKFNKAYYPNGSPSFANPNGGFQLLLTNGAANNVIGGTVDVQGKPLIDAGGQLIGGTVETNRNVLSGTVRSEQNDPVGLAAGNVPGLGVGPGIRLQDIGTTGNLIQGNFIGTDATGLNPFPNYNGIEVLNGAHANFIGNPTDMSGEFGNLITFNKHDGVRFGPTSFPRPGGPFGITYDVLTPNFLSSNSDFLRPENTIDELGSGVRGSVLTIEGSGLTSTQQVTIGGIQAAFTVINDNVLRVTIPVTMALQDGPRSIEVVTAGGTVNSSPLQYRVLPTPPPVIANTAPGNARRGMEIALIGQGFTGTTAIDFNGAAVTDFTVVNDGRINLIVPNGASNAANTITLTTLGGSSTVPFVVDSSPPPTLTSFQPPSGQVGQKIAIFGTNFFGLSEVRFNGVTASKFELDFTGTRVIAEVPNGATSGPITVVTPGGTVTSAANFNVTAPAVPELVSFTPGGQVGRLIGLNGFGFSGAVEVLFNGTPADPSTIDVISDRQLAVRVPVGATSGPITVTTPGGTASSAGLTNPNFTVLTSPIPQIPTFTNERVGAPGSRYRISGANLQTAAAVEFTNVSDPNNPVTVTVGPYNPLTRPNGFQLAPNFDKGGNVIDYDLVVPIPSGQLKANGGTGGTWPGTGASPVGSLPGDTLVTVIGANGPGSLAFADSQISFSGPFDVTNPLFGFVFQTTTIFGESIFVTPAPAATISTVQSVDGSGQPSQTTIRGNVNIDPIADLSSGLLSPGQVRVEGSGLTSVFRVELVNPAFAGGAVDAQFHVVNDNELRFSVPNSLGVGNAAVNNVTVRISSPHSAVTSVDTFNIAPSNTPVITNATNSGRNGDRIFVTGSNFVGVSGVTVGGVNATFQVIDDGKLGFTVPFIAKNADIPAAGKDVNNITVTGPGGTAIDAGDPVTEQFTLLQTVAPTLVQPPPQGRQMEELFAGSDKSFAQPTGFFTTNGSPNPNVGTYGEVVYIRGFNIGGAATPNGGGVFFPGPNGTQVQANNVKAFHYGGAATVLRVVVPQGAISGAIRINVVDGTAAGLNVNSQAYTINNVDVNLLTLGGNFDGDPRGNDVHANLIANNGKALPNATPDRAIDYYNGRGNAPHDPFITTWEPSILNDQFPSMDDDDGVQGVQNYPTIQIASSSIDRTQISTALRSQPFRNYRIDYYINSGPAITANASIMQTYIGSIFVSTDDQGLASAVFELRPENLAHLAVDEDGNPLLPNGVPITFPLPTGTVLTTTATDITPGFFFDGNGNRIPIADGTSRVNFSQEGVEVVFPATGSISGFKFVDENNNGVFDPGIDTPQAGVTIQLDLDGNGIVDAEVVTDVNGFYSFGPTTPGFNGLGLPNGTHKVIEISPPGFAPVGDPFQIVQIITGDQLTDINFLNQKVNQPPIAVDDQFSVPTDSGPNTLDVLANDSDPDGNPLTIVSVTQGNQGGIVTIINGGTAVAYEPPPGFIGTDMFSYTISDGQGGTDSANVTVVVDPSIVPNRPPVAVDDSFEVFPNSFSTNLPVLNNDFDPDGDPIIITEVTQGTQGGVVTIIGGGTLISYQPPAGFIGFDTFTYTISDGQGGFDNATVTVNVTPDAIPPGDQPIVTGPVGFVGHGGTNGIVTIYGFDQSTSKSFVQSRIQPFGPEFTGEIRVAHGDVNGDGVDDIILAAGPGGGPRIRIISGIDGSTLRDFFAFEPSFRGGLYVAAADMNGDQLADIIIGADLGGGSRIRILSGADNTPLGDFFVFELSFTGGVRVSAADVNGDGVPDIIAGAGFTGGPRVTVFDGRDLSGGTRLADFFAFEQSQRDGVFVSGGDFNGDGRADLLIGAGPGGGPRVTVYTLINQQTGLPTMDPSQDEPIYNFFAFNPEDRTGVRVKATDINGDNLADIVVGQGPGRGNRIRTYVSDSNDASTTPNLVEEFFYDGDFLSNTGVWVG